MERTETGRQGGEGAGIKRGSTNKSWKELFHCLSVAFYLAPIPFSPYFCFFFLCLKNQQSIYRRSRDKEWRRLRQNRCNRLLPALWSRAICARPPPPSDLCWTPSSGWWGEQKGGQDKGREGLGGKGLSSQRKGRARWRSSWHGGG